MSSGTIAEPTKPVAPVRNTRIGSPSDDRYGRTASVHGGDHHESDLDPVVNLNHAVCMVTFQYLHHETRAAKKEDGTINLGTEVEVTHEKW
jgi:hypothetical protein